MPLQQTPTYFNVVGGLNTESSPLNMPATDARDILNIKINIDGSVQRRRGIDFVGEKSGGGFFETSTDNFTTLNNGAYADPAISSILFSTINASGILDKYVFVHLGTFVYVYRYESVLSLRDVSTPFQKIDMSEYMGDKAAFYKTCFIADRDKLFFINKYADVGFFAFDVETSGFIFAPINIYIRDIDKDSPDIDSFVNSAGKYYQCVKTHTSGPDNKPGIGENWKDFWAVRGQEFVGKLAWVDAGSPPNSDVLKKRVRRAYGKVSKETFKKYRQMAAGNYTSNVVDYIYHLYGENDETFSKSRFSTGCFATGRLWLSGISSKPNTILFSQTILKENQYGFCFTEADPLNRDDNDTVATDGGTIILTGADSIIGVVPFKAGIIALAKNGIWYIAGNGAFKANDFIISKLTNNGAVGKDAFSVVEDNIIYFGESDIYVISPKSSDDVGTPSVASIGIKITSFYNSIPLANKITSRAIYNTATKKVIFSTNFVDHAWMGERGIYQNHSRSRDFLIFDIRLKAWYKYSLSDDVDGDKISIADMMVMPEGSFSELTVIDNDGDFIIDDSGDNLSARSFAFKETSLINLCVLAQKNGDSVDVSFGSFEGDSLYDFSLSAAHKEIGSARLYTAHQVLGDIIHSKMVA